MFDLKRREQEPDGIVRVLLIPWGGLTWFTHIPCAFRIIWSTIMVVRSGLTVTPRDCASVICVLINVSMSWLFAKIVIRAAALNAVFISRGWGRLVTRILNGECESC